MVGISISSRIQKYNTLVEITIFRVFVAKKASVKFMIWSEVTYWKGKVKGEFFLSYSNGFVETRYTNW